MEKCFKFFKLQICDGIGPLSPPLCFKSRYLSDVRRPSSVGMVPRILANSVNGRNPCETRVCFQSVCLLHYRHAPISRRIGQSLALQSNPPCSCINLGELLLPSNSVSSIANF